MNNDETIYDGQNAMGQVTNQAQDGTKKSKGGLWKALAIGGVSGILLGASKEAIKNYYTEHIKEQMDDVMNDAPENNSETFANPDDMSFADAFAAARAELGPGHTFTWHGAVFSTYTADEWAAMNEAQHEQHVAQAHPDYAASQVNSDVLVAQDAAADQPDVRVTGFSEYQGHLVVGLDVDGDQAADIAVVDADDSGDLSRPDVVMDPQGNAATVGEIQDYYAMEGQSAEGDMVSQAPQADDVPDDQSDVRIVGYGEVEGHLVAGLDVTGDNAADVAIIDVDDSHSVTRPDVIVDTEGNMATVGDVVDYYAAEEQAQAQGGSTYTHAPDPDMPDTMPEAMPDDMQDYGTDDPLIEI